MDLNAWSSVLSSWPHDWILIGGIAIFVSLDAMRSGSARAASIALALPATLFAFNAIPQAYFLGPLLAEYTAPIVHIVLFVVFFALIFFTTYRTVFGASDGGRVLQSLLIGLAATAAIVLVWIQVPALEYAWHFGDQVQAVFAPALRLWWYVAIFTSLAFARS